MAKSDSVSSRKERNKTAHWVISIFAVTVLISGLISLMSDEILSKSGTIAAFFILFAIISIGIMFDVVGVAVTSADEKPFHSMAARKVPGAQESIRLLRNAERVSSICNDVVGDICGVVSGSASAAIAARILGNFSFTWPQIISLAMSAMVAGLTVGGKAVGKTIAMKSATQIVHGVGRLIYSVHHFPMIFGKKKTNR